MEMCDFGVLRAAAGTLPNQYQKISIVANPPNVEKKTELPSTCLQNGQLTGPISPSQPGEHREVLLALDNTSCKEVWSPALSLLKAASLASFPPIALKTRTTLNNASRATFKRNGMFRPFA